MKNRFSIGEMSKLNNVPVKTLRYYDDIGLFKPIEVDENSKYRYYSIEQFEQLNTINYLKFLGLPLKEIKNHLEIRDIRSFLDLLKKRKSITETTINKLESVKAQFAKRIEEINSFSDPEIIQPCLKKLPRRAVLSLHEQMYSEYEWEITLSKLVQGTNSKPALFIGKVGLTIALNNLNNRKLDEYNSVFIVWDDFLEEPSQLKYLRDGYYACICYRGNHSNSAEYYGKLFQFINENGYAIDGDSIERTIINQYITSDQNKHLTEIQIPVKKC
jgi:effector-binding domain-containing protein